jgi:hypothetical protein
VPQKYFDPDFQGPNCQSPCDGKTHFFDMNKDPDEKHPLPGRLFRLNADGVLFYKGKKCRLFTEKDYDALNLR